MNARFRIFFLMALMLGAFGSSIMLKPVAAALSRAQEINLANMIPIEFDDWNIDRSMIPIAPSPEVQAVINKTYEQTLSRTYVNSKGERIMLSIAYSRDYSGKSIQYHRPEICYPSQGFELLSQASANLSTPLGNIQVKRLDTKNNARHEPVTYWVTVAGSRTTFGLKIRWLQVLGNLTGKLPDGLLVRFSSIDHDSVNAYLLHDEFAKSLLKSMEPVDALKLAGAIPEQSKKE